MYHLHVSSVNFYKSFALQRLKPLDPLPSGRKALSQVDLDQEASTLMTSSPAYLEMPVNNLLDKNLGASTL